MYVCMCPCLPEIVHSFHTLFFTFVALDQIILLSFQVQSDHRDYVSHLKEDIVKLERQCVQNGGSSIPLSCVIFFNTSETFTQVKGT